jgi:23S rRNA (cytidine1920-2'-O)/16S rRNA (cytidine1409-2'-O)-methyltransferase
MDVSFISATLVLPAVVRSAFAQMRGPGSRQLVVLVKPQFEAGREHVGKGGIIRDPAVQASAVEKVTRCLLELAFHNIEVIESPILGAEGNREFLLHAIFD